MAKIVLISPPYKLDYMRNARCDFVSLSSSSWFPIWLAQAGALLEGRGHKTKLLDSQVYKLTTQQALHEVTSFKPDFVAVYTGRLSEDTDIEFADSIESFGIKTVFVGPYASIDPSNLLSKTKKSNLLIQREFDLPLLELVDGASESEIKNLILKKDGQIVKNDVRPLYSREILDSFPLTTPYIHENLDITKYKTPSEPFPFIDVMSGRGCAWGRCNFCLWVQSFVPGTVYNTRSIDHFLGEFRYIMKQMPHIKSVMIQDDMLTNSRAEEIADGLLALNFNKNWSCYAKPNSRLSNDTLKKMKRSGCLNLHVGFESGDDVILKKIDKGSTAQQALEFAEQVHSAGLNIHGDFAVGHLGETAESAKKTRELAIRIRPHSAQFQIMIPFKNTRFHSQLDDGQMWNSLGEPSYEKQGGLSAEEIRREAKKSYRAFYISIAHLKQILHSPKAQLIDRLDQYAKAIPAVFWKRWIK